MQFSTHAIHTGQEPDAETGAVIPPIYMTSTYAQQAPGVFKGYDYTRAGNPNFTNLETALAALEHGAHATVYSSGLGALNALIATLSSGDEVVVSNDVYGGTYRIFSKIFSKFGVRFRTIDMQDMSAVEETLSRKPAFILIETPSNPLLKIVDIKSIVTQAHKHNTRVVVDNTFATPYAQQPLELGADIVLHSTTKYIGGHSDVIGGALIHNDAELKKELDFNRMALGLNPSPFDVWLAHRGLKTLAVRMEQHTRNAQSLAEYLEQHPLVQQVYYPGLASHNDHTDAKKQMSRFGGIISVEFNLDLEQSKQLISSFKVFTLAESLGGIESLVDHPASMTHASIPKEEREKAGLSDGLVRFSVGIEHVDDLQNDLAHALAAFG